MVLWTPEHLQTLLPAIGIMLLICIGLRLWLGKKSLKIRMIPLQVVAVILLLLEVGKQAISISRGYDLYHIPLHFCSLLLYTLPPMVFYNGKYTQQVRTLGTASCCAVFWLTAIYPDLIYSAGNIQNYFVNYLDFHTVTFHNLAMLAFLMVLFLDLHTPAKKGEHRLIIVYLTVFCVIAAVVSQFLQTNYAGFYQCNVGPIEDVRQMLIPIISYPLAQMIYVTGLMAVHYGFVIGFYCVYKCLRKLLVKKTPAAV